MVTRGPCPGFGLRAVKVSMGGVPPASTHDYGMSVAEVLLRARVFQPDELCL